MGEKKNMSIDYRAVGGIGIYVDDNIQDILISKGFFTLKDWERDSYECLEKVCIPFRTAGNCFSGDPYYYFLVAGRTITEINRNVPIFIEHLGTVGIIISEHDLIVVSDIFIS